MTKRTTLPTSTQPTHCAFADESHWNTGRYRAIGLVTLEAVNRKTIEQGVRRILARHPDVSELKWSKIDRDQEQELAQALFLRTIDWACDKKLRIDVLIWDIEDSRHKVHRRDDLNNLQRLLYRIFVTVCPRRWPRNALWSIHPDDQAAIDWPGLARMLRLGFTLQSRHQPGLPSLHSPSPRLVTLSPVDSSKTPLVTLADLFAGLAVFSYEHRSAFLLWRQQQHGQQSLPLDLKSHEKLSRRSQRRCKLLDTVLSECKKRGIPVRLEESTGLETPNPNCWLNFWFYRPQGSYDKAPTKPRSDTRPAHHT